MMTSKDGDNSPEIETKPELKNPDRRHVLGVAALAAAFTAGQVESAVAEDKKKAKPANKAAATTTAHGGEEPPEHPPGNAKYRKITDFHDLPNKPVYHDAAMYRKMMTDYATMLRTQLNLPDTEFTHIIRLELKPSARSGHNIKSSSCGCGCS
jgi:hypothetical protein